MVESFSGPKFTVFFIFTDMKDVPKDKLPLKRGASDMK